MNGSAERVLVLAPTGRDAVMIRDRLAALGLSTEVCPDLDALLAGIGGEAGAAIVAREALTKEGAQRLLEVLEAQEPWSDLPVLLLAEARGKGPTHLHPLPAFFESANVTLLQRPLSLQFFASSIRAAVRARRRQYQMRDLYRELARAVELGDLFVGILGHDLRTPLAAVRLSAQTILKLSPDARALRPAGRILTAADRMNRMIGQLLDLARIRQGRGIPLQLGTADLGEVCRQVVQELEDADPQAVLRFHQAGDVSGRWDADRLGQVVSNLLGNAVQHGTAGEPVEVELDGTGPTAVRLVVRNAGSIPEAALPTLFDAFKGPGREAATSKRSGLGLGLFIARETVRAHGGDVRVESAGGRTVFEVALPRQAPAAGTGDLV